MNKILVIKNMLTGIVFLCLMVGCTKEGEVGARGEQGEQGVQGVDGEDGTKVYSGSDVPAANLGEIGDFYFHTTTSDFYGPKTALGWGVATNLRGATGATGATGEAGVAGSKILSGTNIPTSTLGAVGDFYFQANTADFYGPKESAGWGMPINLKGIKGDDGSRIYSGAVIPAPSLGKEGDFYFHTTTSDFYGPKTALGWGVATNLRGATGATGATGEAGVAGSKILSGTNIPTSALGAVGDFYFQTNTADFYGPKVSTSWGIPTNLKGIKGDDGSRIYSGAVIPALSLGKEGDFYFHTATSDFYGPKTATSWGTATNLRGTAGVAGSQILSGTGVPASSLGAVGDFYLRTSDATLYGPKVVAGWGMPISLRGPAGPPGTSNVVYSDWITPPCTTCYNFNINAPLLTADIFNRGQIMVYMRVDNHGSYEIVPLSEGWHHTSEYRIGFTAQIGTIIIRSSNMTIGNNVFRYVLIPGGVSAHASLNIQDYSQVKAVFSLQD